jgi:uncharacterized membrane protein YkvA (DUF1232 family)
MTAHRLGAFRTIVTAVRTAMRPGSPSMGERASAVPRLVRATFRGEYPGSTRGRLLLVLGGIAYVVSPVDFVPEAFLAVFGLADDAMVASWVAATFVNETESFLRWERARSRDDAGHRSGGFGGRWGRRHQEADHDAAHETVPGHVVG